MHSSAGTETARQHSLVEYVDYFVDQAYSDVLEKQSNQPHHANDFAGLAEERQALDLSLVGRVAATATSSLTPTPPYSFDKRISPQLSQQPESVSVSTTKPTYDSSDHSVQGGMWSGGNHVGVGGSSCVNRGMGRSAEPYETLHQNLLQAFKEHYQVMAHEWFFNLYQEYRYAVEQTEYARQQAKLKYQDDIYYQTNVSLFYNMERSVLAKNFSQVLKSGRTNPQTELNSGTINEQATGTRLIIDQSGGSTGSQTACSSPGSCASELVEGQEQLTMSCKPLVIEPCPSPPPPQLGTTDFGTGDVTSSCFGTSLYTDPGCNQVMDASVPNPQMTSFELSMNNSTGSSRSPVSTRTSEPIDSTSGAPSETANIDVSMTNEDDDDVIITHTSGLKDAPSDSKKQCKTVIVSPVGGEPSREPLTAPSSVHTVKQETVQVTSQSTHPIQPGPVLTTRASAGSPSKIKSSTSTESCAPEKVEAHPVGSVTVKPEGVVGGSGVSRHEDLLKALKKFTSQAAIRSKLLEVASRESKVDSAPQQQQSASVVNKTQLPQVVASKDEKSNINQSHQQPGPLLETVEGSKGTKCETVPVSQQPPLEIVPTEQRLSRPQEMVLDVRQPPQEMIPGGQKLPEKTARSDQQLLPDVVSGSQQLPQETVPSGKWQVSDSASPSTSRASALSPPPTYLISQFKTDNGQVSRSTALSLPTIGTSYRSDEEQTNSCVKQEQGATSAAVSLLPAALPARPGGVEVKSLQRSSSERMDTSDKSQIDSDAGRKNGGAIPESLVTEYQQALDKVIKSKKRVNRSKSEPYIIGGQNQLTEAGSPGPMGGALRKLLPKPLVISPQEVYTLSPDNVPPRGRQTCRAKRMAVEPISGEVPACTPRTERSLPRRASCSATQQSPTVQAVGPTEPKQRCLTDEDGAGQQPSLYKESVAEQQSVVGSSSSNSRSIEAAPPDRSTGIMSGARSPITIQDSSDDEDNQERPQNNTLTNTTGSGRGSQEEEWPSVDESSLSTTQELDENLHAMVQDTTVWPKVDLQQSVEGAGSSKAAKGYKFYPLSVESRQILLEWLSKHKHNPHPSEEEVETLAEQIGDTTAAVKRFMAKERMIMKKRSFQKICRQQEKKDKKKRLKER